MSNSLLQTYKFQAKNSLSGTAIIYGFLTLLLIIFMAIPASGKNSGGFDSIAMIYFFVIGISSYVKEFHLGLANGVTRRTFFLSTILTAGTLAVVGTILNVIFYFLFSLTNANYSAIPAYYNDISDGKVSMFLTLGLLPFTMIFSFILLGYFITSLLHKFPNWAKAATISGCAILPLVLTIFIESFAGENFIKLLQKISEFFIENIVFIPQNLSLFFIVFAGIFAGLFFLCLRKTKIKSNIS